MIFFVKIKGDENEKNIGIPKLKKDLNSELNLVEEDDSFEIKVKKIFRENQLKNKESVKNSAPLGFIQQSTKARILIIYFNYLIL